VLFVSFVPFVSFVRFVFAERDVHSSLLARDQPRAE
jgi:hypothetical protein